MDIELGLLRYFCFLIAGKEAERKYISEHDSIIDEAKLMENAGADYGLVREKLHFLESNGNSIKVDIENLSHHVYTYLDSPTVWMSVQNLASKLLYAQELSELEPIDHPVPSFTPTLNLCKNATSYKQLAPDRNP